MMRRLSFADLPVESVENIAMQLDESQDYVSLALTTQQNNDTLLTPSAIKRYVMERYTDDAVSYLFRRLHLNPIAECLHLFLDTPGTLTIPQVSTDALKECIRYCIDNDGKNTSELIKILGQVRRCNADSDSEIQNQLQLVFHYAARLALSRHQMVLLHSMVNDHGVLAKDVCDELWYVRLIKEGQLETLSYLLSNGAELDNMEMLPAIVSTASHVAIKNFLLKYLKDVNSAAYQQCLDSTWMNAVSTGDADDMEMLMENHQINQEVLQQFASSLCRRGHPGCLQVLFKHGFTITDPLELHFALYSAIKMNQTEIVSVLIENGMDIHKKEDAPLRLAINEGSLEMVRTLIEGGCPFASLETIQLARDNERADIEAYLLEWI